jgi:hypothetical protein
VRICQIKNPGPVLLELMLVDVETGAKHIERRFQPFGSILEFTAAEVFEVHTYRASAQRRRP